MQAADSNVPISRLGEHSQDWQKRPGEGPGLREDDAQRQSTRKGEANVQVYREHARR